MNKLTELMSLGFVAFSLVMMTSCSDDKDEPNPNPGEETVDKVNPATVFANGIPAQVGKYVITKNNNGLVTKIVKGDEVTTFDYAPSLKSKSRAAVRPTDYDMTMNVEWGNDKDGVDFYIKLNAQGYIAYAFEEDEDEHDGLTCNEWWFKYNDKGQLVEMKRTEGHNEVTTINYDTAGDITGVLLKDDTNVNEYTATIGYTDATHTSPILNKGGVMLYDESFGIDMDEMAPAYYAGILGKGTTHLPLTTKEVEKYNWGQFTYASSFVWEFNADNMPTKFISTTTGTGGSHTSDPIIFKW